LPPSTSVRVYSNAQRNPVLTIAVRGDEDCELFEKALLSILNNSAIPSEDSSLIDQQHGNQNGSLDLGDLLLMLKGIKPNLIARILSIPAEPVGSELGGSHVDH
jgi:hypothetical protein